MADLMVIKTLTYTTMSGESTVKSASSSTDVAVLMFFNSIAEVVSNVQPVSIVVIEISPTEYNHISYDSIVIQNACIGTSIQINGPPTLNNKYSNPSFTISTVCHSIISHLIQSIEFFYINVNAVLPLTEVK